MRRGPRLERRHLPPRLGAAGRDGPARARPPRAARRRDGARRRLRLGPRHRLLLERLPRGRVIAVDASPEMVARAREELATRAPTSARPTSPTLRLADGEQVDAVFSNATFTGCPTTTRCSRPGRGAAARRAAQRPVRGRGQRRRRARRGAAGRGRRRPGRALRRLAGPWNFAGPEQTEARLRAAGFADVRCWPQAWPVEPDEPRAYLETVCLGPHLERLAPPSASASSTP